MDSNMVRPRSTEPSRISSSAVCTSTLTCLRLGKDWVARSSALRTLSGSAFLSPTWRICARMCASHTLADCPNRLVAVFRVCAAMSS